MSSVAALWSPLLFGFALFLSAALLFLIQPMIGRTLLPHLGGNPVAWNACLVFFQATLLAGYVYAGLLHRFRGLRWQPLLQIVLFGAAVTLLFTGAFGDHLLGDYAARLDSLDTWPVLTTLCLLIVVAGLPVLLLAAIGPLMQRWFAHLHHPKASDPYFLFVASNLGGLTALVIYALLIEPNTPLYAQWMAWKLAATALGVTLFLAALVAWTSPRNPELEPPPPSADPNAPVLPRLIGRGPATWSRRWYWFIASALPVGLMMSVTDYLTLDVAPAPVLWALPLALYLLAFSQAFGRFSPLEKRGRVGTVIAHVGLGLVLAMAIGVTAIVAASPGNLREKDSEVAGMLGVCFFFMLLMPRGWIVVLQPFSALIVVFTQVNVFALHGLTMGVLIIHLTCFYLSTRLCLGMLADDRPAATALTTYFTWMGVGGLAGGAFQLLVAPLLFPRDYLEFALLAALACALRPAWTLNGFSDWAIGKAIAAGDKGEPTRRRLGLAFDIAIPVMLTAGVGAFFLTVRQFVEPPGHAPGWHAIRSLFADFPLVLALFFATLLYLRPVRLGLALAAIVLLSGIGSRGKTEETQLVRQRTPFGIIDVRERQQAAPLAMTERYLMHSTTYHGNCIIEPVDLRRYPTTYYHELGPIGRVMQTTAWFAPPLPPGDVKGAGIDWQQRHRNFQKGDARLAASLVGQGASLLSPPLQAQLLTTWSEPPYAIVGLGVGSLYCYAHPYQWVDAYELDPAIAELSTQEPPVFLAAAMAKTRGVRGEIKTGDGRRSLARSERDHFYQMIFIDAFNSDAVPVHLLTEEAIVLYFRKLAPDGVVCFHTSNRYVDLATVLQKSAERLNAAMFVAKDEGNHDVPGYFASEWVLLARDAQALNRYVDRQRFQPKDEVIAPFDFRRQVWTDEHASLLSAVGSLGDVVVRVFTSSLGGTSTALTSADKFTYVNGPTPAPVITSVSPNFGALAGGTEITITGTNLDNAEAVNFYVGAFGGPPGNIVSDTPTQLVVDAPAYQGGSSAATDIRVTTPNGVSAVTAADRFYYAVTANTAAVVTAPQAILAGQISGTILVQLQDGHGNPAVAGPNGVTFNLTSSSATGTFLDFSNNPITTVTIGAGASSAAFAYTDTTPGTPTLSMSATGFTTITQKETIAAAADLHVTNTNDSGVGSLRQAILTANAGSGKTIVIDPTVTGTIDLATALPTLSANMTIYGPGANLLTIERKAGAATNFGIFAVKSGAAVTITGVTIANADSTGVVNNGSLTLKRVVIENNHASGLVAVAPYGGPGGIFNSGTLTLIASTVANNTTSHSLVAAGIDSEGGSIFVLESTISGNYADHTNSAGGIGIYGGTAFIAFSTITGNTANDGNISGGGIDASGTSTSIYNTIVAGNTGAAQNLSDVNGTFTSFGNNLIGSAADSASGFTGADLVGTVAAPIDAKLDPTLQFNGGTTLTNALLVGSPAIDAGSNFDAPPTDQRGAARITNSTVDIGAFEFNLPDFGIESAPGATFIAGQTNSFTVTSIPGGGGAVATLSAPALANMLGGSISLVDHGDGTAILSGMPSGISGDRGD